MAKVRFARVPTGAETCEFCMMLASRGFVYASPETAGEFNHYHPNCDCRIVPGFQGLTKVQGYDPDEIYAKWRAGDYANNKQEADLKHYSVEENAYWKKYNDNRTRKEIADQAKVDFEFVNSLKYENLFESAVGKNHELFTDKARKALKHRAGTLFEDLYAINIDNGHYVAVLNSKQPSEVVPNVSMNEKISQWAEKGEKFAMLHNHPESTIPSTADIVAIANRGAEFGIISCHDGSLYKYEIVDKNLFSNADEPDIIFNYIFTKLGHGISEDIIFRNVEVAYGVKIEHFT